MRKPDRTEIKLDRLADLRASGDAKSIAPYLADNHNLVCAKAARIAGELQMIELRPDLEQAFERRMRDPAKLDKGCAALTAIVRSLYSMDYTESAVYLAGIRHIQLEASFGKSIDVACELRGISALGLARTRYEGTMFELVRLLADPEWEARRSAARAVACTNDPGAAPVLHLKTILGDESADVIGECYEGLLVLAPGRYLPFVVDCIQTAGEVEAEAALLALGSARTEAAVRAIIDRWTTLRPSLVPAAAAALAESRSEPAMAFLASRIEVEPPGMTAGMLRALAPFAADERLRTQLRQAVDKRGDGGVAEAYASSFARFD